MQRHPAPSLERFYTKIERHINVVQSYLEQSDIAFLIKACRLKPYQHIFHPIKRYYRIELYRWWIDEFGNSLHIDGKKRIKITYNDLQLKPSKIVSTDLYAGLTMERIAKISSMVHIISGKDEDLGQKCYLMTFLGLDHHLRSYLYWFGEWQIVSPLLLEWSALSELAKYRDQRYFRELSNAKNCLLGCQESWGWLSYLPCGYDFRQTIKDYDVLKGILVP